MTNIGVRFELGEPVLAIRIRITMYTNELLAESKIQTVYIHNTRSLTIKIYAGITTLVFARKPSAKAKKNATATTGIEHTHSHECGVCVSAVPIAACKISVNIQI